VPRRTCAVHSGRCRPPASDILALSDGRFGFKVAHPATGTRVSTESYQDVRAHRERAEQAERLRLYYVAMTRAIDRLIVSGSIDPERSGDESTPIGWVLGRLEAPELESAGGAPVEIDRDGARLILRVDRFAPGAAQNGPVDGDESQLALFAVEDGQVAIAEAPRLPELAPVPEPPENRVRRLSYSALALFELCSYRFYVERFVGLRETKPMLGVGDREPGLAATEIGDSAHVILEGLDLADPRPPEDLAAAVRAAKEYVSAAIAASERLAIGSGHGPVHPDPEARCDQLRQCFAKKSGLTARDDTR
jgi:hypothetical protein